MTMEGKGHYFRFADICKCFDRVRLVDAHYIASQTPRQPRSSPNSLTPMSCLCDVQGSKKFWIQETKKQIKESPVNIQSFKIKVAHSEKYLGHKVVSGIVSDITDANIKMNARKVHQAATEIRQDVQDPRIERIGSLKACALFIQ